MKSIVESTQLRQPIASIYVYIKSARILRSSLHRKSLIEDWYGFRLSRVTGLSGVASGGLGRQTDPYGVYGACDGQRDYDAWLAKECGKTRQRFEQEYAKRTSKDVVLPTKAAGPWNSLERAFRWPTL